METAISYSIGLSSHRADHFFQTGDILLPCLPGFFSTLQLGKLFFWRQGFKLALAAVPINILKDAVQDGESQLCNSGAVFIKCLAALTEQFQIAFILLFADKFPAVGFLDVAFAMVLHSCFKFCLVVCGFLFDVPLELGADALPYYSFFDASTQEEWQQRVDAILELSLYDTGVVPQYGDQLLTLSTCGVATVTTNSRFAVLAVKIN